jgi:hypothetical protein
MGHQTCRHAFIDAMAGNPVRVITLKEMLNEIHAHLGTTVAGTELGRTLQLFRAARVEVSG